VVYKRQVQEWIKTLKGLQEQLGRFNDLQVLQAKLPADSALQPRLREQEVLGLEDWPLQQQRYRNPAEQQRLYQLLFSAGESSNGEAQVVG
ncbi:CHAD domain-containing protein, partial [Synechococcus sp. H55.10]|uniref:CHAD domain-containing protein n=1 Tax=Synechococcus sp. H55.10 TaxID=2964503 RepID=UPI0039C760D6